LTNIQYDTLTKTIITIDDMEKYEILNFGNYIFLNLISRLKYVYCRFILFYIYLGIVI